MTPPAVLTIAGSDCSAGAGIQADLKTISAFGGYALTALTSVVSETPGRVSKVQLLEPAFVADQIRVLATAFPIQSAKTGMLGGRAQVEAVVQVWQEAFPLTLPLVVDPVMVATGGGRLLEEDAIDCMCRTLFPLATVLTPNMDEAQVLWGRPVRTREEMEDCATQLSARYGTALLVKGGHLQGATAADVLCVAGNCTWFESARTSGVHTHGTGCTYSAAIATGLGHGLDLPAAVRKAKAFVSQAIQQHHAWATVGGGEVHALNHLQQI